MFGAEPGTGSGSPLFLLLPLILLGPAALTLWLLYRWHPGERPPAQSVVQLFFAGFGTALPAIALEMVLLAALAPAMLGGAAMPLVFALLALGVGLSEEFGKLWFLNRFGVRQHGVNSLYTGVLFGMAVGLGFATIENQGYIYGFAAQDAGNGWLGFALLRSVLPAPAHALFGAIMGYGVARAALATTRSERRRWLAAAYLIPVVWHGLFNFCLFMAAESEGIGPWLWYGVFGLVVLTLWVTGICVVLLARSESRPATTAEPAPPITLPPLPALLPPPVVASTATDGDLSVWARPR